MSVESILTQYSWIAWLILGIEAIGRVIRALKEIDWIWGRFKPKPNWSDGELRRETEKLVKDLSKFHYERSLFDHGPHPLWGIDDENERKRVWAEYIKESSEHSLETKSLFGANYSIRIAKVKEEFSRKGKSDEELERFTKLPVNMIEIQFVIQSLSRLLAKI